MKKLYFSVILSLFAVKSYAVNNMLINGSTSVTVFADATFELTFSFEQAGAEAKGIMYLDANGNGQLDADDPWLFKRKLTDGNFDDEDEDAGNGQYREICEPFKFSGKFLFYAEDNGVGDTVALTVDKVSSSYSVSGTVNPPANQVNILVSLIEVIDQASGVFDYGYGDFTDNTGAYSIGVPNSYGNKWWNIIAIDPAIVVPFYGSNDPVADSIYIDGHITKNLGMRLVTPDTTTVWGVLKDDAGTAITDPAPVIGIATTMGGFQRIIRTWKTDNNGAYRIPLKRAVSAMGWAYLASAEIENQFYCQYMNPTPSDAMGSGTSPFQINLNLKAYRTNATISGHVYKDAAPYDKCELHCNAEGYGNNFTKTYSDGQYEMCVSNQASTYKVAIARKSIPAGYIPVPVEHTAAPGATGVDFNLIGVEETSKPEFLVSLTVYPNPFMSRVVFKLLGSIGVGNLVIRDIAGKYVGEIKPETKDGETQFILSEKIPIGIYFYFLPAGNKVFKGKVIKLQ